MNEAEEIIEQIRWWLKNGATIKATDTTKPVLEQTVPGRWEGGLTISLPPPEKKYKGFVSRLFN